MASDIGQAEISSLEAVSQLLVIESEEVDTVGGLLGYELGRVPLPGSRVDFHGLTLIGEGGADQKGRVRVSTVLVERVPTPNDPQDESETEPNEQSDA